MAAPGAPRAPTQTLPGYRKAQGQGEQAAWGATPGSLTHSPRPGSTKGMRGWLGPLHHGDRDSIQLLRDGAAAAASPCSSSSGRGCSVASQPGGRHYPSALCPGGGGSCHVRGCSGSLLLPPASTLASKSHLSQPVQPQEVCSGTGDRPVSTSFVTEVV